MTNPDGTTVNERLFAPKHDSSGAVLNQPELDDPDFFRYVNLNGQSDLNWLDDTHTNPYPTQDAIGFAGSPGSPAQHNNRVEAWRSIAKSVIPGPNVDLILLPHNSDNTLAYDTGGPSACTAAGCPGVAHSGVAHDPVGGGYYPIINTSVTFRPGTVSGDATPATTSDYSGAGAPLLAGNTGVGYVPTVYTTGNQSWAQPYKVTLTPPAAPSGQVGGGAGFYIAQDPATGDYLEYSSASGTAVYDSTTGAPASGVTSYIPLTLNADTGTLNFATPALLDPANDRYKRDWVYTPTLVNGQYQVDLKQDYGAYKSPLGHIQDAGTYTDDSGQTILTARIVPGSLRVYGPDATAGPGQGQRVLYTEAGTGSAASTLTAENQYTVDYATGILTFTGPDNGTQFASMAVTVLYEYQANMAPVGPVDTGSKLKSYTMTPFGVSVDYQTRDLISVSIGLRIYDISTGRAQVIPAETKIKIGNSNR